MVAIDDRDVAFFFFCGHSDTGLDLVNTADFSLVSLQPYELVYRRSHSIEQSTSFTTHYYYTYQDLSRIIKFPRIKISKVDLL